MLYDNGLLLALLSRAHRHEPNPLFRMRIDDTVGWLLREMRMPGGGFASSLDADTEHEEGLTYTWTWEELEEALGGKLAAFAGLYDATPGGNWEDKIILNRLAAHARGWLGDDREAELKRLRALLLERRNQRPQPARDDKILADWNGLAISGLAAAARATGNSAAREAAIGAFRFVAESMARGDRLAHSALDGTLVFPGVATDYANMIRAALDLFALTGEADYIERAEAWFAAADRHHYVADAAAYSLIADDAPALIAQPLSISDEATPAATGTMAANAATLFMLTSARSYRERAEAPAAHLSARAGADVVGSASLQAGFDTLLRGRLAYVIGTGVEADRLLASALAEADPAMIAAAVKPGTIRAGHPADGKHPTQAAALFLCDAFRCLPEITAIDAAKTTLAATRRGLA
jgi:uncharacterized protein YyaL (SSP411 family)